MAIEVRKAQNGNVSDWGMSLENFLYELSKTVHSVGGEEDIHV